MSLLPSCSVVGWALLAVSPPCALAAQNPEAQNLEAQKPERAPRHLVIGKVENPGGAWKAAQVFFFSQSRLEGIEAEDAAIGRQGSKLGILARLQAGREYRVAARLTREGKPALWTRIQRIPPGSTTFVLEPSSLPPARPTLRLHGRDAWKDRCVLQFRLLDALGRNRPLADCLDKDGKLPSLPGSHCWVEMRMREGRRLHLFAIPLEDKNSPSVLNLEVPPPIQMRLRVLDSATDAPIEGARVFDDYSRPEDIRTPGLRTDKSGSLWFWIARPTNEYGEIDLSRRMQFRVFAEGRQLGCAGWNSDHLGADTQIPRPQEHGGLDLDIHLPIAKKIQGKLLHFPSELLGKFRLFVRMQAKMPTNTDQQIWTALPWFEVPIQQDGSYEFPRLSDDEIHIQTGIYFADELIPSWNKLQAEGKALSRSERILPLPAVRVREGAKDSRLPPINNKLLELLDLRVQLADGSRGRDLPIRILFPDNETSTAERTRLLGNFDGLGRYRRVFYGRAPALFIQGAMDYALLENDVRRRVRRAHPGKASVIKLMAMPTIRGQVLLVDGTPGAGSRVFLRAHQLGLARFSGGPATRYFKAITSFALNTQVETRADGSFEIPYLPYPERRLRLIATLRDADGGYHSQSRLLPCGHKKRVTLTYTR